MKQAVFLLVILGLFVFGSGVEAEQKVVFLDVGQGDAILLQDGYRQVLVDGGPGMSVLAPLAREMPWMDRRIEVVILTHPQRDHMEGLLHVLERYEVGMILLPYASNKSLMQEEWLKMISELGIPYRFANFGQGIEVGDINIDILGPMGGEAMGAAVKADVNNASVVTRVEFCGGGTPHPSPLPSKGEGTKAGDPNGVKGEGTNAGDRCLSFLLTGDAEKRVEKMLVSDAKVEEGVRNLASRVSDPLNVDILKAGHHGSKTSTTQKLLDAASPKLAVISVGAENKFGHPSREVLERLGDMPIWRTDERGSVVFERWDGRWYLFGRKLAR